MEVLEDQPFEVLDSAGDMNQEQSQLGACVRACYNLWYVCVCAAVIVVTCFFFLLKQASDKFPF